MTLLLIASGWVVAAVLTAGLFAALARGGRRPEPTSEPDLPGPAVQLPRQRSAPAEVRPLESLR